MPFIAALKAHKLTALALSLIRAAARLAHHLSAFGFWTPL